MIRPKYILSVYMGGRVLGPIAHPLRVQEGQPNRVKGLAGRAQRQAVMEG